jgi:hypothetical protein
MANTKGPKLDTIPKNQDDVPITPYSVSKPIFKNFGMVPYALEMYLPLLERSLSSRCAYPKFPKPSPDLVSGSGPIRDSSRRR